MRSRYARCVQRGAVFDQWNESAPFWEKHRAAIDRMFAPVTTALVEDAGIVRGQAVLDVATGPGEPALTLAALVGAEGRVVGVDVVPAMIEAARREAARKGLANADFQTASADDLPFGAAAFDAVVSRFGVMFFPAPLAGLREMLRVARPGGRLALAAWHHVRKNPLHALIADIIERFFPDEPLPPDAPDAFRFAPPGKLLAVAREAGVVDASERLLEFSIEAPLTLEEFWVVRAEMSDKLRTKLARLSQPEVAAVRSAFLDAARAYARPGGVSFPAEVLVVSGRRREDERSS